MGTDAPLCDISEDKIVEFETEVRMIPQFDPENPRMISQGPSICLFNKADPQEVLASWLFMQYLLTDEVQIAYSQTEGYTPVTAKAQNTDTYQEYLKNAGQDTDLYYDVKLKAVHLLLDHTEDTFVTPVFNGSASLRDAAGQLVENTVKGVRRGQKVDDAYIQQLYDDVNSLYRLNQINSRGMDLTSTKRELGKMPTESLILLVSLLIIWIGILFYIVRQILKNRKNHTDRNDTAT